MSASFHAQPRQEQVDAPTLAGRVPRCVLLIEDNEGVVRSLSAVLSNSARQRFVVRCAGTVGEGIEILNSSGVDVVVLDLSLPDSSGVDTFFKVHRAAPHLPIIILSGTSDEELAVRLVHEGAQDYCIKGEGDIHLLPRAIRYAIERKLAEQALRSSERHLHALAHRLQVVREEDRVRLARDLHDRIGQDLTMLKLELRALAGELAKHSVRLQEKAIEIDESVTSTINAVREICSELRPHMLDDLGLFAALEWHAQQFTKRTGIDCRFSGSGERILDPDRRVALYRVVQEALTNVLRHSRAESVEICAAESGTHLQVTVQDNGGGITTEDIQQRRSLGIIGMRERVECFGGSFAITGSPGKGTQIIITLPFDSA